MKKLVPKKQGGRKIRREHETLIFEAKCLGKTLREIQKRLSEEYQIEVSLQAIDQYFRRHLDRYEEYVSALKDVRLANAKARLLEMQSVANRLKEKILEVMSYAPKLWQKLKLANLINSYINIMEQIAVDAGDRRHGDRRSDAPSQNLIFNDVTINQFADQVLQARREEIVVQRDRIETSRLSDSRDSLPNP